METMNKKASLVSSEITGILKLITIIGMFGIVLTLLIVPLMYEIGASNTAPTTITESPDNIYDYVATGVSYVFSGFVAFVNSVVTTISDVFTCIVFGLC